MAGTPQHRFTLYHPVLYPTGVVVPIPLGWRDAKLTLERDKNFHSLIEYFKSDFIWYGKGREVIREIETLDGPNGKVRVVIELRINYTWSTVFDGQIDISQIEDIAKANTFYKSKAPIIRDDFWAKFINKKSTLYNLGTDDKIVLPMPSQKIRNLHVSQEKNGLFRAIDAHNYFQYLPDILSIAEIKDFFSIPISQNVSLPVWIFEFKYDGVINWDLVLEYSRVNVDGFKTPRSGVVLDVFIKKNDDAEIEFSYTEPTYTDADAYSNWEFPPVTDDVETAIASYNGSMTITKGDIVRIYIKHDGSTENGTLVSYWGIDGAGIPVGAPTFGFSSRPSGMVERPTYFDASFDSTYPETETDAFLIRDAADKILQQITDESDVLVTPIFDTLRKNIALLKGKHQRGYTFSEKEFFMSFDNWWNGANPLLNLGLGYVQGENKIEIDSKASFWDSTPVVLFDNVPDLKRRNDLDKFFKNVETGFEKWSAESDSGIDDMQTKRSRKTLYDNFGKDEKILSSFYMASLGIEQARRNRVELGKDFPLDEDIMAIRLVETDYGYTPEVGTDFDSVSGLLNPDERINIRDTPTTIFKRWQNYLQGCMQFYPTENFEFNGGEGNYNVEVEYPVGDYEFPGETINEKQDIGVTTDFLFIPRVYECTVPMSKEKYDTILANRKKAIGISQSTTGHVAMHILNLDYKIMAGSADLLVILGENVEI